jgi:hypothetical protein
LLERPGFVYAFDWHPRSGCNGCGSETLADTATQFYFGEGNWYNCLGRELVQYHLRKETCYSLYLKKGTGTASTLERVETVIY